MRHPYTPLFRDFVMSSMWAADPATRCVWIWFLLMADPEGYVAAAVPGVAQQVGVPLEQARAAIEMLESPDPDSSTPDFEGRRLVKVPRGWHIVNFVAYRERAKLEAEKARKRTWAQKKRATQLSLPFPEPDSVDMSTDVDASSETIDAPKPKPKLLSSEGEGSPLPPARVGEPEDGTRHVRRVVFSLDGWEPSEELANAAVMAGVKKFGEHIARLRRGPIGGTRGVFADELDAYIESMFGKWRTWEETDRAKDAQRSAAPAPSSRFGSRPVPVDPFEPEPRQRAFAKKHGLDLETLLKGVLDDYPQPSPAMSRRDVLSERLTAAAKQKREGQLPTGKLTLEQARAWGSVPPGGVIPREEVA